MPQAELVAKKEALKALEERDKAGLVTRFSSQFTCFTEYKKDKRGAQRA